jgi:serine/threonine protein kinase
LGDSGLDGADRTEATPSRAPEAQLRPGEQVGRYIVLSTLGSGGMSVVFLAYDPELDRKVALKLMRSGGLGTLGRARLQREAQALARLSHPNVVPVYDVGQHGDETFMAMEHVEGETLRRWLKQPRTWREIVAVLVEAGRGLAAAHAAGIVHRDFKPDNVLIGKDGRVRVVDFGLARDVAGLDGTMSSSDAHSSGSGGASRASGSRPAVRAPEPEALAEPAGELTATLAEAQSVADTPGAPARPSTRDLEPLRDVSYDDSLGHRQSLEQLTRADHVVGTPAYMAPEQMRRGATDERADQFSFCVTLYEALYRQKPFPGKRKVDPHEAVTAAEKPGAQPRQIAMAPPRDAGVPRRIERLVMRGLSADPLHRFASIDELLRQLAHDPDIVRRRVAAGVVVAGVAAAAMVLGLRGGGGARPPLCRGGEARFAEVWSARVAGEIRGAFGATGLGYAGASADAFARGMDEYGGAWARAHRAACEATRVRGEQSEAAMDLRMACLERRRAQAAALVDVMRHPDADTVLGAGAAPAALPAIDDCDDVAALESVARPREPAAAARLEKLRDRLAQVQALYAAGRAKPALDAANALGADVDPRAFPAVAAELALWRGRAAADLGVQDVSVPSFRDAFTLAMTAHDDRVLAEAAARLAQEYLYANELDAFHTWVQVARAAVARGGGRGSMEFFVEQLECMAHFYDGKNKTRLACLREHARRVSAKQELSEWQLSMLGIAAGEAGEPLEALRWLRQGVERARREFGDDHPRTIEMRAYLCKGYLDVGDDARAADECRDALARLLVVAPDQKPLAARLNLYLGSAFAGLGQRDEARAALTAAEADDDVKGEALTELAELDARARDWRASAAHARESFDADAKLFQPGHPNLVADAMMLAQALLEGGDAPGAVAALDPAAAAMDATEVNPMFVAEVRFTLARALWDGRPAERGRARALAEQALDGYVTRAPDTPRFRESRKAIEAWLLAHPAPGAAGPAGPATR